MFSGANSSRGSFRAPVLIGVIVLVAVAFALPRSIARGQDVNATLAAVVEAGILDPALAAQAAEGGPVEAIVQYDDTNVTGPAEAEKRRRGLDEDDKDILELKARGFRAAKDQVRAKTGDKMTVLTEYDHFAVQHVRFESAAALASAASDPSVRSILPNRTYAVQLAESLPLIQQPLAQLAGRTGSGVSVAVLDTGVDYLRPHFGCTGVNTPASTCRVQHVQDFATEDGARDANGHGTNVSGIVSAVAPGAKILGLDVFTGSSASDDDIILALEFTVTNQATYNIRAVNMSLGSTQYSLSACASLYTTVFASLRAAGIIPVVSSGNAASSSGTFQDGISTPACTAGALSVGAVYDSVLATLPTWGGCPGATAEVSTAVDKVTCFSQSGANLGMLAPGAMANSAGIQQGGTSQASPHVAGAVAVLASAVPSQTVTQRQASLTGTGPNVLDPRNNVTKHRLDLCLALVNAGSNCTGATPTNDNRANATVMTASPALFRHSTIGFTVEGTDPLHSCTSAADGASAWFKLTTTTGGTLSANTNNSHYPGILGGLDSVLSVHRLNGANLEEVACDDESGDGSLSSLSVALLASNTYYIEANAYSTGPGGYLVLNMSYTGTLSGGGSGATTSIGWNGNLTDAVVNTNLPVQPSIEARLAGGSRNTGENTATVTLCLDGPSLPSCPATPEPGDPLPTWDLPDALMERGIVKRGLTFWQPRAYPLEDIPPEAVLNSYNAIVAFDAQQGAASLTPSLAGNAWQSVGPSPMASGQVGTDFHDTPMTGRVTALAADPTNANRWLLGFANGGLWETTNAGASWQSLNSAAATLTVGAIAIAPSNPQVIYVGTGEANLSGDSYAGLGVFKSTNGGTSWTLVGSSTFSGAAISSIVIDPTNPNIAVASSTVGRAGSSGGYPSTIPNTGLFRTMDGGTSWTQTLTSGTDRIFGSDVQAQPGTFANMYAGVGWSGSTIVHGLYRSTTGGTAWAAVAGPWDATGDVGILKVAFAPSAPSTMYVTIADDFDTPAGPFDGALLGLWRTDNAFAPVPTWTQIDASGSAPGAGANASHLGFCGWNAPFGSAGNQCWYDMVISVDPTNANTFYAGGINVYKYNGASWTEVSGYNNSLADGIHADIHAFAWAGSRLLVGTDGGIWSLTGGGTTRNNHNTAPLSGQQFYDGALHPTDAAQMMGGAQDNGTDKRTNSDSWSLVSGGDGASPAYSTSAPNTTWMTSFQSLNIRRTTDAGLNEASVTTGLGGTKPFIGKVEQCPTNQNILLAGSSTVYKTTNMFSSASAAGVTWAATGSGSFTTTQAPWTAIAFAKSVSSCNTWAAGSTNGWFSITTDGGATTMVTLDPSNQVPNRYISDLAFDPANANVLYVTLSGFDQGTPGFPGHVFKSTNALSGAATWTNVSPPSDVPFNTIVVDPENSQNVYAGSDFGVWKSSNGGTSWTHFTPADGMPNVAVFDLEVNATTQSLVAFTHGRGAFRLIQQTVSPGTLQFTSATYQANENGGTFSAVVSRTGGSSGNASATCTVSNGTAQSGSDYTATVSQPLQWTDGDAVAKSCTITITDDSSVESNETVNFTLSGVTGASAGTPVASVLTITDNDSPGAPTLTCSGGLTKTFANGLADFSGCKVSATGNGYRIVATSTGLLAANSTQFNVTSGSGGGPTEALRWSTEPQNVPAGVDMNDISVEAVGPGGGRNTADNSTLVTLQTGAGAPLTTSQVTVASGNPDPVQIHLLRQAIPGATLRATYASDSSRLESVTATRGALTLASNDPPEAIANRFLANIAQAAGFSNALSTYTVQKVDTTPRTGLTVVGYRQVVEGFQVFDAYAKVGVAADGRVVSFSSTLKDATSISHANKPNISQDEAIAITEAAVGPRATVPATDPESASVAEALTPRAEQVAYFDGSILRLAFRVLFPQDDDYWMTIIDQETGAIVSQASLQANDAPEGAVFTEHPDAGPRTVEPFESTIPGHTDWFGSGCNIGQSPCTVGNNTNTFLARDGLAGALFYFFQVSGIFTFPWTDGWRQLGATGIDADVSATVTNLFYFTNVVHDWFYELGFTEASANFQVNNFGLGGTGGDPVLSLSQYGAASCDIPQSTCRNNANFSTLPDGQDGLMRMYLFDSPVRRDGSVDGDVVVHEYGHGLSNRLIDPVDADGLTGVQSRGMGEGWSDYWSSTRFNDPIMGEYVTGNATTGIRFFSYEGHPWTYGHVCKTDTGAGPFCSEHREGEIWAGTLWNLRKDLIAEGQVANDVDQLVMDGLKLTPQSPSMLDARDAIIAADDVNTGGAFECLIWQTFSEKGMGFSASSNGHNDQDPVEAFDLPPTCDTNPIPTLTCDQPLTQALSSGVATWTNCSFDGPSDTGMEVWAATDNVGISDTDVVLINVTDPAYDATCDGAYTGNDALATLRMVAGFTSGLLPSAPCTGNPDGGSLGVTDARAIRLLVALLN